MSSNVPVAPISDAAATEKVTSIFDEIRSTMGDVPVIFRIIAHIPMYLETTWRRIQFVFGTDGHLTRRTKWMIALAISASNNNKAMILASTERLKATGVSDQEIAELMAVVDLTNGLNKVLKAASVDFN